MEVEALIEGSPISRLRDEVEKGMVSEIKWRAVERAWSERETWRQRYLIGDDVDSNQPRGALGGTICVHFIKKNEWFLETALALLGSDEVSHGEDGGAFQL
jgi:hypothetical protein